MLNYFEKSFSYLYIYSMNFKKKIVADRRYLVLLQYARNACFIFDRSGNCNACTMLQISFLFFFSQQCNPAKKVKE